jgi:hypothetical protein
MKEQEQLADELATLTGKNWYLEHTGGGCTALVLQADPKIWAHYFMVTHCEDASVPQANEPHHLGEYINEDQDINHYYFLNREELLAHLNGETK